ncbi:glycosyltransferase family 4 protein [Aequorivita vladivostokensis]|uniref:Glycosyl transferase family 1 n=1 Tax=Aequorivita vladivostokensis TaxID=171194 RepID=A0ABR5DFQ7_9FLAO|nr:glycosyltransferase family 1 protein [Aequorivita vladivostokensis]KJJ37598.1 glycosyl transferase family 1 [Aequorivita vladivostokensis]
MKQVFLESHNLKNRYSGFGQFNYHFIKALAALPQDDFEIVLNAKNISELKEEFGDTFKYRKYNSLTRHKPFRIKKKYNLWHCLNQNIKIEPFFNIPYLLTVHDVHFVTEGCAELQEKLKKQFAEKLKRSSAIAYISEFAKQDTHAHFEVPNIPEYVIYNGNTITDISIPTDYKPSLLPPKPYLFSIGDFSDRKNFMSLVEMLRFLPEYNLVLSGSNSSSYAEKLTEKVKQYGFENRVFQTGKIADLEKQYYLQNCEAFVFPSLREGFGIPPIEAMRFGKPVFLSNNTSLPEIGGEHSFFWDHYDPQYMAQTLRAGMEKFHGNRAFYENWYTARAQSFNWKTTAEKYIEVYKSLL